MNITVNGAGRIGRCLIRKILLDDKLELSQVNDPYITAANFCYLLKFDSVYGLSKKKLKLINNNEIRYGKKKNNLYKVKKFLCE